MNQDHCFESGCLNRVCQRGIVAATKPVSRPPRLICWPFSDSSDLSRDESDLHSVALTFVERGQRGSHPVESGRSTRRWLRGEYTLGARANRLVHRGAQGVRHSPRRNPLRMRFA